MTFHMRIRRELTQLNPFCRISATHQPDDAPIPVPNSIQPREPPRCTQGSGAAPQTCMWLCGFSWMPVTRSAWPPMSRRVSSVFTLYTFTKSPDTYSRYLQGETLLTSPERPGRPAAAAGRDDTGGQSPARRSETPLNASPRPPAPLTWNRRRTRPWRRAGRCPHIAPRGARPAPPSCPAATRALGPAPPTAAWPRPPLLSPVHS